MSVVRPVGPVVLRVPAVVMVVTVAVSRKVVKRVVRRASMRLRSVLGLGAVVAARRRRLLRWDPLCFGRGQMCLFSLPVLFSGIDSGGLKGLMGLCIGNG